MMIITLIVIITIAMIKVMSVTRILMIAIEVQYLQGRCALLYEAR